jgi:predicted nucleotidyltransferase component of viral defense system
VEAIEKVVRLGEILTELDSDPLLAGNLVLRGGTALNLEVANPPRLSVDLDFDYVGAVDRASMLEAKPRVMRSIQDNSQSLGYRVTTAKDAAAGSSLKLDYTNALGSQDLVKVDISWTNRVGIEPTRRVLLWQPQGVDPLEFTLVGRSDLVAGKFRALIDRVAARDVFDAVRIAEGYGDQWPPMEIRNAFVFTTGTLDLPLTDYSVERLERLTVEDFNNNLVPMLSPGSLPSHPDLIAAAKIALSPLLDLNESQREFVFTLDRGELKPELLFAEEDAIRLALHPHLRWKAQNRRDHLTKKP